jgi:F0F1-type ATP synthase membrane subunit b/b'
MENIFVGIAITIIIILFFLAIRLVIINKPIQKRLEKIYEKREQKLKDE